MNNLRRKQEKVDCPCCLAPAGKRCVHVHAHTLGGGCPSRLHKADLITPLPKGNLCGIPKIHPVPTKVVGGMSAACRAKSHKTCKGRYAPGHGPLQPCTCPCHH